jgi:DNA-directed RNA polymerase subunit RPC12/RpoP
MTQLECAFCKATFNGDATLRMTVCPQCGESTPVKVSTGTTTDTPLSAKPSGGLWKWSILATVLIVLGSGYYFWNKSQKKPTVEPDKPYVPATKPPALLPTLKYLPKDSQIIASLQPSPVWQYAERTGQHPTDLLEQLGLPAGVLTGLADVGLAPEKLADITVSARVNELPPRLVIVLSLREPLKDPTRLRQKLQAKVKDPTQRDVWTVQLPNVPLYSFSLLEVNDRTLVLCSNENDLELARKPHAGVNDLSQGMKESIDRLSPSSMAWVATSQEDWAKLKSVELLSTVLKKPEIAQRLTGLRAAAACLSLEPELTIRMAVMTADIASAKAMMEKQQDKAKETNAILGTNGAWVELSVPVDPPKDHLPKLKRWLEP